MGDKRGKCLLVINPASGEKLGLRLKKLMVDILSENFLNVDAYITKNDSDFLYYAKIAEKEVYTAYFVAGGDGSVNCVINALCQLDKPPYLGIFPLGTVNDLARALGYCNLPRLAIRQGKHLQLVPLDVGRVNGQYFANVIALGPLPNAVSETRPEVKAKIGSFAYYIEGFKTLFNRKIVNYHLKIDGKTQNVKSELLLVGLTSSVGGFSNMFRRASYNDSLLHLLTFKPEYRLSQVPQLLNQAFLGDISKAPGFTYQTAKEIEISVCGETEQLYSNVDGDMGPALPLKIEVVSNTLKVYRPN